MRRCPSYLTVFDDGSTGASACRRGTMAPAIADTVSMAENRVRPGRPGRPGTGERHAVHRETGSGLAELVPDMSRTASWLLFLDGIPQSQVDLEDPGYLEFEYMRRIGHVADLAFPPGEPLRALHLGGGAMTLPRYIAHTRPGSAQLVAELDAELTELVRRHLPLPGRRGAAGANGSDVPGARDARGVRGTRETRGQQDPRGEQETQREQDIRGERDARAGRGAGGGRGGHGAGRIRVRAGDAREVLESVPAASYDLVISDVFTGTRTPFHLTTAECARAAARALRPGGVYVANVADGPPLERVRAAVATVRSVFKETCMIAEAAVVRGRRLGNLVLAGSERALPCDELRRATAADPFPARVLDGAELIRFSSGAPVVTDAAGPLHTVPQSTNW